MHDLQPSWPRWVLGLAVTLLWPLLGMPILVGQS